jgi:hypothetical protein
MDEREGKPTGRVVQTTGSTNDAERPSTFLRRSAEIENGKGRETTPKGAVSGSNPKAPGSGIFTPPSV